MKEGTRSGIYYRRTCLQAQEALDGVPVDTALHSLNEAGWRKEEFAQYLAQRPELPEDAFPLAPFRDVDPSAPFLGPSGRPPPQAVQRWRWAALQISTKPCAMHCRGECLSELRRR